MCCTALHFITVFALFVFVLCVDNKDNNNNNNNNNNKPLTVTPLCTKTTNLAVSEGSQVENAPKRRTLVSENNKKLTVSASQGSQQGVSKVVFTNKSHKGREVDKVLEKPSCSYDSIANNKLTCSKKKNRNMQEKKQ